MQTGIEISNNAVNEFGAQWAAGPNVEVVYFVMHGNALPTKLPIRPPTPQSPTSPVQVLAAVLNHVDAHAHGLSPDHSSLLRQPLSLPAHVAAAAVHARDPSSDRSPLLCRNSRIPLSVARWLSPHAPRAPTAPLCFAGMWDFLHMSPRWSSPPAALAPTAPVSFARVSDLLQTWLQWLSPPATGAQVDSRITAGIGIWLLSSTWRSSPPTAQAPCSTHLFVRIEILIVCYSHPLSLPL